VKVSPKGFRIPETISNIWPLVERFAATVLGGVPTSIGAMSEVPVGDANISTLRFVLTGGAPLPKAVASRFEASTGIALLEQYGMTETNAALATTPLHGEHKRGSVGLRCPFSDLSIMTANESGEWVVCERGETGVVTCKGPQVVSGYLDDQHTAETFTPEGALISGDMGYLDADGYLYLTGREKDVIIRSGHNIDPSSIEEVVNAFDSVSLSAAVGMPDEYAGEVPVVFVMPSEGQAIDVSRLQAYINQHIHEPPARPRHVFTIDEIPTTGVGKIFKPRLRQLALEHKLAEILRSLDETLTLIEVRSESDDYQVVIGGAPLPGHAQIEQKFDTAISELPIKAGLRWENYRA
jgi:fatty-acyl-CoA synthase